MNVLITTGIFPPEVGGPATYVPEIVKRLKSKHQFKILTFTQHPFNPFPDTPVIVISQKGNALERQLHLFNQIVRFRQWIDVIYAQDPLVVGLTAGLAGKLLGKKVVIRYGGDPAWEAAFGQGKTKKMLVEFLEQPNLHVFLTRLSFLLSDKIITNSQFLKTVTQNAYGINSSKTTIIHNAIEAKPLTAKRQKNKKAFTVLSFGRLVTWKKYDQIISAVKKINNRKKIKVKLIIFGDGPEKAKLKKLGKGFLELLPSKSHQKALEYLRRADVYVLNSLYEGSPNQVIEAFSVGTPVVATNVSGTNEVAVNNKTAVTVKPNNIEGLSLAIERILTNKALAEKLVTGGKKMLGKFTWEAHLTQLYNVFNDLVNRYPHSS